MADVMRKVVKKDVRQLIHRITGFHEREENFQLCFNYADSNIKYHRFLSPDSHKVERAVIGLCEKFEVHSQAQKAADLRDLVDIFLEQPGFEGKDTGKTDVHYALLTLLMELAESPTSTDFQRRYKKDEEEELDDFDWGAYLLDSENFNFISYASSDSEDEESLRSEEDEEEISGNEMNSGKNESSQAHPSPIGDERTTDPSPAHRDSVHTWPLSHDQSQPDSEYSDLEHSVVVQYWKGKEREQGSCGGHSSCNLSRDWNCYLRRMDELYTPRAQCLVTELQIVRETLWMLSGSTSLFIFHHRAGSYSLSPDIYVVHLTVDSLESFVRPLMKKANQLQVLQSFIESVMSQACQEPVRGEACMPQTYQAFASSVSCFLHEFRASLVELEKRVMKQEELMSLSKLTTDLRPWLIKVQTVYGVYMSGVASAWDDAQDKECNSVKATHLLDVLYQAVMEANLTSELAGDGQCVLLFEMLIQSIRPMLRMASDWTNNGQLVDTAGEFVIKRDKNIKSLDNTFWEKAFVPNIKTQGVRDESADVTGHERLTDQTSSTAHKSNASLSAGSVTAGGDSTQQLTEDNNLSEVTTSPGASPKFLQHILGDVILTGKSMEMLESLGRMGDELEIHSSIYEKPPSLYKLFVRELLSRLAWSVPEQPSETISSQENKNLTATDPLRNQISLWGEKDILLDINFSTVFPEPCSQSNRYQKEQVFRLPAELKDSVSSQLLDVCRACLYPHIRDRYHTVCSKLVRILKSEYHLMECIHAMQRYFLMSAGEVMYDFYTNVFHKIQTREHWQDVGALEMFLHEAVDPRYPQDTTRLSVTLVPLSRSQKAEAINITDCIRLKYWVPWPVDVIISTKCQELYNDIFSFMLQIKRAKFSLDELIVEELCRVQSVPVDPVLAAAGVEEELPRAVRIHRLQLFKFRLLYFVNSLHSYIMTRILHSTGLEFESPLESAEDVEQIISTHQKYVQAIHERCLLHPKLHFLKKAVGRILTLSLACSGQWRQGVDFISGTAIVGLELELTRCIHFLSSFLNNVIKRGSFPHLESLAFALVSSMQSPTAQP